MTNSPINNNLNKVNHLNDTSFDDIRPLKDAEVKGAIESLLNDEMFKRAVTPVIAPIPWDKFANQMRSYSTVNEFQENVIYTLITKFIESNTDKLWLSNPENVDLKQSHVYISNHRDIVLDAGLFNILLFENGIQTTEIAIGDNLLIFPWITTLVRLNKNFIVKRGVSMRQVIETSKHLSEYIHRTVREDKQSVWIAQREGRAKDSNDRTQTSLLKMLALVNSKDTLGSIKALDMVPLSISYEYDPCDYLKAKEFQLKRDLVDYKKTNEDDLINMYTGIVGYKGRVCFKLGKPLNEKIDSVSDTNKKSVILEEVANLIDEEIFKHYEFFPPNYIAYDLIKNTNEFTDKYTPDEKEKFIAYLNKQVDKIDIENKDMLFLKQKITEMYANTLINHLSVCR